MLGMVAERRRDPTTARARLFATPLHEETSDASDPTRVRSLRLEPQRRGRSHESPCLREQDQCPHRHFDQWRDGYTKVILRPWNGATARADARPGAQRPASAEPPSAGRG